MMSEKRSQATIARNIANATHGHTRDGLRSPTYKSWASMRERCLKQSHKSYARYKGFEIYAPWQKSFQCFLDHVGERPKGTTLDRIDNEKGYVPGNVRWATYKQQGRNRRTNRKFEYHGELLCIAELAEILGVSRQTMRYRLNQGMTAEEAVSAGAPNHGRRLLSTSD